MTFGDAILLAMAPVVLGAAWRWKHARTWLCFLALWWLAAAFTEVIIHDSWRNTLYALCRPSVVALDFCGALWILQRGIVVARAYIAALVVGLTAAIYLYPSAGVSANAWKFGYGTVVSLGVILVAAFMLNRGRRLMATLLVAAVAVVSLLHGFRSEFLITSIATVVCLLTSRRGTGLAWRHYVLVGGVLIASTAAVYVGYGHLAASGQLGTEQQTRWVRQSRVEGGLLFGARPEVIASATVIADPSPVGRGVSPEVSQQTRAEFLEKLRSLDIEVRENFERYYFSRGLYLHSVLFQQWAETGILVLPGLLFPVLVLLWALMTAVRIGSGSVTMVFCFLLSQLVWDTLFSPWPRLQGVYLGTATAAAVVYLARHAKTGPAALPLRGRPSGKSRLP